MLVAARCSATISSMTNPWPGLCVKAKRYYPCFVRVFRDTWEGGGERRERDRERQKRNEHETCGINEVTVGSRSVFHYGIYMVINWIRSIFFFYHFNLDGDKCNGKKCKIEKYGRIFFFRHCTYVNGLINLLYLFRFKFCVYHNSRELS